MPSKTASFPPNSESSVRPQPQQGMGSSVLERLKDEIAILKVAAVGALLSTLREMVKQAVPTLAPHNERARTKRGGQPIERPGSSRPQCPVQGETEAPSENAGRGRQRRICSTTRHLEQFRHPAAWLGIGEQLLDYCKSSNRIGPRGA